MLYTQSTYMGRVELRGVHTAYALAAGAYITTLYVMVHRVKKGWRAPPPLPGWDDLSIMMEFTPESGRCHSVCTLWLYIIYVTRDVIWSKWESRVTIFVR
jgi:hypothetical protein